MFQSILCSSVSDVIAWNSVSEPLWYSYTCGPGIEHAKNHETENLHKKTKRQFCTHFFLKSLKSAKKAGIEGIWYSAKRSAFLAFLVTFISFSLKFHVAKEHWSDFKPKNLTKSLGCSLLFGLDGEVPRRAAKRGMVFKFLRLSC